MVQSIPIATFPAGRGYRGHWQAMRQDMIGYLEHLAQQGDLLRIPLGLGSAYFVNQSDLVQEVLLKQSRKFQKPFTVKYTAQGLFGANLFTSDGALWQVLRATLQPAFHAQRLQLYANIMTEYTQDMVAKWQPGQVVDIPTAMMDLTLGITTKSLFDQDLRNQSAAQAIVRFIELFSQRISGLPVPIWLPLPSNLEMKRQIAIIDAHLSPLIVERRQSGKDHGDLLSMLIQAQATDTSGLITDHQVKNEVLNLFAAGYEVTAYTLAFALYLIAQHPAVEARLLAEIDRLGQRPITLSDLAQLPYLEMVLKEAMRLYPVTTVVARQATETVMLGHHAIAKNSAVLIAPWTLHRRSDYFADPLCFQPDRFTPDHQEQMPKFAYLPFSAGPRVCIGNAFAMMQMRINLATILQRYRLSTVPGYQFEPIYQFNTRIRYGLPMQLQARAPQTDADPVRMGSQ